MNVVLVMFRENGERRSFSLSRDVTVIGRREDADFRIPLSDVSRKHCRLIKDGNQLIVEDLGSANGTLVNGERVSDHEVVPGDTLQIGPLQFIVQIDGVPSEEELEGAHVTSNDASNDSGATRVARPAGAHPAPPPVPAHLMRDDAGTEEVVEDELEIVIDDDSADSVVADDDIIIDLGEAEESEKH
jgi:pSer/pThr/pTyr-binding forkhead associated (FHA) protein